MQSDNTSHGRLILGHIKDYFISDLAEGKVRVRAEKLLS